MGFSKEGKARRVLRLIKTLFFLITMLISLLLFSPPVLLSIADSLLPFALLSASLSPSSLSLHSVSSHLTHYHFRHSLIDIPLISLIRSAIILCVYSFCDGPSLSRGPYLGVATVCSVSSLVFVSIKASLFGFDDSGVDRGRYGRAMEVGLFLCSMVLGMGHVVVTYRTSCRERRKLLVYKIDIEATKEDEEEGWRRREGRRRRKEDWRGHNHRGGGGGGGAGGHGGGAATATIGEAVAVVRRSARRWCCDDRRWCCLLLFLFSSLLPPLFSPSFSSPLPSVCSKMKERKKEEEKKKKKIEPKSSQEIRATKLFPT